jgi:outer membrane protein assembly factor BamD
LNEGDPFFAAKKFLEAELLFPQSLWAPRSALMASYSYYMQNYYAESLANLERYIKTYPTDKNIPYAHYLIAMCYYETIEDEKRDADPLIRAKNKFNYVVKEYPNTDFALDAKFKLLLIDNILASKEIYVGKYYLDKKKWIPAMNRFKNVVKNYQETEYVEEAIHRLVEINYILGLENEAKKYAVLLGYNYKSSKWYKESYRVFNKEYKNPKEQIKKDKGSKIIKKFKELFN